MLAPTPMNKENQSSLDTVFSSFAPASQSPLTPLTDRAMDAIIQRIVPLGPVRVVTNHNNTWLALELGEADLRATIQTASRHLDSFEVFVDGTSFYMHNDGRSIRGWHLPDRLAFREFNLQ